MWVWRYIHEAEPLWCQVVQSNHGKDLYNWHTSGNLGWQQDLQFFIVELDHGFRITKAWEDRSSTLSLKKESRSWLSSCFNILIDAPLNQEFLQKCCLDEYDLWVEKTSICKGHCAEVVQLDIYGGLDKVIIPLGIEKKGWKFFISLIKESNQPSPPLIPRVLVRMF